MTDNFTPRFDKLPILVVGDLMLDRFVYGDAERISPESPVPVLAIGREDLALGGAGNVLNNLAALGTTPSILAVVGVDEAADRIRNLFEKAGVERDGLIEDKTRPTTEKIRFLARNQQLLRADRERVAALDPALESQLVAAAERKMCAVKALVLSDYGKGVLSPAVIQKLIGLARDAGVPVLVDPKGRDYAIYRGADVVTPNRKELAEATGASRLSSDAEIVFAAKKLIQQSGMKAVVATRSEHGLSVVTDETEVHYRAEARQVFDVSGAGDTVIAVLAACLASGVALEAAGHIANVAGGLAVAKVGTSPVYRDELDVAFASGGAYAVSGWEQAARQVALWQAAGLKVGFTNGCFDIVHAGHVGYLEQARRRCDRLVLALNSDASVRLLKGPTRPVNDEEARARVIAGLSSVDLVVLFGAEKPGDDNTPCDLLKTLEPDVYFKGGDYKVEQLPEARVVEAYGGAVDIMPLYDGFSTTSIIAKSQNAG